MRYQDLQEVGIKSVEDNQAYINGYQGNNHPEVLQTQNQGAAHGATQYGYVARQASYHVPFNRPLVDRNLHVLETHAAAEPEER